MSGMNKLDVFNKTQVKKDVPETKPGDVLRIRQKIKEGGKEKTQAFEGILIAKKHGKGPNATITVRKDSFGVMVERTYPIHSPTIDIEIVSRAKKVRRAKLYYLRKAIGKKAKVKQRALKEHEIPHRIVRDEKPKAVKEEKEAEEKVTKKKVAATKLKKTQAKKQEASEKKSKKK